MDRLSPPDSPGQFETDDNNMATMVANGSASNMPGPPQGVNRRYRPAPAKTFQCRGYGECRMVFSRSEHLARHIRKHTGERPFSCHCSKQFSRLDNLRQHAQTVHADKQDQNERMMRDLTSLHATMAAANKPRPGGRRPPAGNTSSADRASPTEGSLNLIKQEEMGSMPIHQRPGTSTGYEGDMMYYDDSISSRTASNSSFRETRQQNSFREHDQSFLAPSTSSVNSAAAAAAQSQSFLGYPGTVHYISGSSSSSRPTTSSGLADSQHPRSLPPLAAVVSASFPSPPEHHQQPSQSSSSHQSASQQQQSQSILPFPGSLALRRPSTATRPGTAPASASFFSAKSSLSDRFGLGSSSGHRPDLSLLHSGFGGRSSSSGFSEQHQQLFQLGAAADASEVSTSPGGVHDSSPFYFHPPALDSSSSTAPATSPSGINPRKRAFGGPDGPLDDAPATSAPSLRSERPSSSAGLLSELSYEYGSESRPQSRRLSVMELCNDDEQQRQRPTSSYQREREREYASGSGAFLLSAATGAAHGYGGSASRPTTSSGLVHSTSSLHIFDQSGPSSATAASSGTSQQQQSSGLFPRASYAAAGAAGDGSPATTSSGGGGSSQEFGRGGVYAPVFGRIPSSGSAPSPGTSASSASSSPSTPTFPPPGVLSTSSSGSSAYSSYQHQRGAYAGHHQQQQYPQEQQQQYTHAYQPHPRQQQQQQHAQYQFAHSPTFSAASGDTRSPRSPISDGSSAGSPFAAYAQPRPREPAVYGDGHGMRA